MACRNWSACKDYLKKIHLTCCTDSVCNGCAVFVVAVVIRNVLLVHLQILLLMTNVAWRLQRLVASMPWLRLLAPAKLKGS